MNERVAKWFLDAYLACQDIQAFVSGQTLGDYRDDEKTRSAVERKFEIVGEALNRIRSADPDSLEPIRNHHAVIGFRNILAHGYDRIDEILVWSIIETKLPHLIEDLVKIPEVKKEL